MSWRCRCSERMYALNTRYESGSTPSGSGSAQRVSAVTVVHGGTLQRRLSVQGMVNERIVSMRRVCHNRPGAAAHRQGGALVS